MVWLVVAVGGWRDEDPIPGAKRRIQAEGGVNGLLAELWMYQRDVRLWWVTSPGVGVEAE